MNGITYSIVAAAIYCLAEPATAADFSVTRITTQSAEAVSSCFAASQKRANNALAFVPNERSGGVFTNTSASGVSNAYTLRVIDHGRHRTVSMIPANPNMAPQPPVTAAIENCL